MILQLLSYKLFIQPTQHFMFKRFFTNAFFFKNVTPKTYAYHPGFARNLNNLSFYKPARSTQKPLFALAFLLYFPYSINMLDQQKIANTSSNNVSNKVHQSNNVLEKEKQSFWRKIWEIIRHMIRFFQLIIIFSPPILTFPLLFFQKTKQFWMDLFVKSVERAGVVFIKAFQYLSHRRDIIGPQLAHKFEYLRENAPTHSFQTTKKYFKQLYGKNIEDIFQQFEKKPIASGSVSQVYRAKYKGKKVAVKVRHPNVDIHIQRDVNLLFFLSYLASFIWPQAQIPISETSLKRTLMEQMDFTFQMRNLNKFNQMFKESQQIFFPQPFEEDTKDSVLVQTFVEGIPVTYYEKQRHPLNKVIARLGSTTFFEMLMKNNFVHGDCHGGNIIIDIQQQSYNILTQIVAYLKELYFDLETKVKSWKFDKQDMRKLYIQSRNEELSIKKLLRKYKQKIVVNLIDVGMVIQLTERDKKNFVNFIKSVIQGRGDMCAQLIYSLSNFQGKKIVQGKFESYYQQLVNCFSILNNQALADLKGINLFGQMLQIIRQNRMKLDGQFATLLTNMIVLEAIAKDIDPQINLLKCAFPYFKYVQDFGVYTKPTAPTA